MKFIITENRVLDFLNKIIDDTINDLKDMKEENWRNIPDEISDYTWDDIEQVLQMRITNIEKKKSTWDVTVDVTFDSVSGIHLDDIMWDIQELLRNKTGINITFHEGEVRNKYLEYGQW